MWIYLFLGAIMDKTDIRRYYWTCPKCETKVNVIEQIVRNLFDEDDGEAFFEVEKDKGVPLHGIICPNCSSCWWIRISGMVDLK